MFIQRMATINGHYQDALEEANPDDFDGDEAAEEFGSLLHTVQDFYAHSNWVNYPELRDSLVDGGTTLWTTAAAPAGVTFLQGHSVTDFSSFEATSDFRVLVGTAAGPSRGIVSGSFDGGNQAPVDITHDQLNHDHNGDSDGDPPLDRSSVRPGPWPSSRRARVREARRAGPQPIWREGRGRVDLPVGQARPSFAGCRASARRRRGPRPCVRHRHDGQHVRRHRRREGGGDGDHRRDQPREALHPDRSRPLQGCGRQLRHEDGAAVHDGR